MPRYALCFVSPHSCHGLASSMVCKQYTFSPIYICTLHLHVLAAFTSIYFFPLDACFRLGVRPISGGYALLSSVAYKLTEDTLYRLFNHQYIHTYIHIHFTSKICLFNSHIIHKIGCQVGFAPVLGL